MNTASLELCKQLYELSHWKGTYFVRAQTVSPDANFGETFHSTEEITFAGYIETIPAYDLGYLLRKLPEETIVRKHYLGYQQEWQAEHPHASPTTQYAGTPEDAVCKLAIGMFKQGILQSTKGGSSE